MSQAVTDQDFQKEVLDTEGVTVVDFWAEWCGPCRVQGPIIDKLAEEFKGNSKIKFMKLDVDANPETASKYQILSIPSLLFFKGGERVDGFIGLQSEDRIREKASELAV